MSDQQEPQEELTPEEFAARYKTMLTECGDCGADHESHGLLLIHQAEEHA